MHSSSVKLGRPEGGRSDIDDSKRCKYEVGYGGMTKVS